MSISTVHIWHVSTPAVLPGHLSSLKHQVIWRTALFLPPGTGRGDVSFFHSSIAFFPLRVTLKVTEPRLWRCWCQSSWWWSGCSEMLSGSRGRGFSSAQARGDRPRQGSDPGVPGGWWSPWWSGHLYSWSCCCCPVSGSGWNDQRD